MKTEWLLILNIFNVFKDNKLKKVANTTRILLYYNYSKKSCLYPALINEISHFSKKST